MSAGLISAGWQLTANATAGENWMPSCLLEGTRADVDPAF
jgi:hypothetical protein